MAEFEPRIVGFLCQWCSAAAADLAGTTRTQYPANLMPVRVPCSGAVDPVYILKALLSGADAVLVGGCRPGDCHHVSGNYKAARRVAVLKAVFEALGLDDDRVHAKWLGASEGNEFARTVTDIAAETKKQGPNPLSGDWAI